MIHFEDGITTKSQFAFSFEYGSGHSRYMYIMDGIIEEEGFILFPAVVDKLNRF